MIVRPFPVARPPQQQHSLLVVRSLQLIININFIFPPNYCPVCTRALHTVLRNTRHGVRCQVTHGHISHPLDCLQSAIINMIFAILSIWPSIVAIIFCKINHPSDIDLFSFNTILLTTNKQSKKHVLIIVTPGPRSRAALTAGGCEADGWCPREILLAQHPAARPGVTMLG